MQQAVSAAIERVVVERRTLVCVLAVVGFAAATALAAQVRLPLPFSPVPITLQTFMVLLAGVALGSRMGAGSQALYVAVGACGAPVFAGAAAGLTGFTAGYLLAFPLAAWIAGKAWERRGVLVPAAGLAGASLLILVSGSAWLAAVTGMPLSTALAAGLVPFLPGDAFKLVAAWLIAAPVAHFYRRTEGGR